MLTVVIKILVIVFLVTMIANMIAKIIRREGFFENALDRDATWIGLGVFAMLAWLLHELHDTLSTEVMSGVISMLCQSFLMIVAFHYGMKNGKEIGKS